MRKISRWSINDVDWSCFDCEQVDSDLVDAVKVACLVESRGDYYGNYLYEIFLGHDDFRPILKEWGTDEKKHGDVLRKWLELADPGFDFDKALSRYIHMAGVPKSNSGKSIRGGLANELTSRCVVESATSAFYLSIMDKSKEPLLKTICESIAKDEIRHYKLFKKKLESNDAGNNTVIQRALVLLKRITEGSDDQLTMAYFCAKQGKIYSYREWNRVMLARMHSIYNKSRIRSFVVLNMGLLKVRSKSIVIDIVTHVAWMLSRLSVRGGA